MPFADLAVTTNFTFLEGAAHPQPTVARAAALGRLPGRRIPGPSLLGAHAPTEARAAQLMSLAPPPRRPGRQTPFALARFAIVAGPPRWRRGGPWW